MIESSKEVWKQIPDYPDYYVSNLGRVKSCRCNDSKILSPADSRAYKVITLLDCQGHKKVIPVHRVVLETFVGPPPSDDEDRVNHINRDRADNRLKNLEWSTHKECFDSKPESVKWRDVPPSERDPHSSSKLSKSDVLEIKDSDETNKFLAEKYNVSTQTIYRIKSGKTWKWLID